MSENCNYDHTPGKEARFCIKCGIGIAPRSEEDMQRYGIDPRMTTQGDGDFDFIVPRGDGLFVKHSDAASRLAAAEQRETQGFDAIFAAVPEACDEHGKDLTLADKITILVDNYAKTEQRIAELERERDSWRRVSERLESEKVTLSSHLAESRQALETIAEWKFDIRGDCVADATNLAKSALSALEGKR